MEQHSQCLCFFSSLPVFVHRAPRRGGATSGRSCSTITPSGLTWASQSSLCRCSASSASRPKPRRMKRSLWWFTAGKIWSEVSVSFLRSVNTGFIPFFFLFVVAVQRRRGPDGHVHRPGQHAEADKRREQRQHHGLPQTHPHTEELPGSDRGQRATVCHIRRHVMFQQASVWTLFTQRV